MTSNVKATDAKVVRKKYGLKAVAIFAVDQDGNIQMVSAGEDEFSADAIENWATWLQTQQVYTLVPFQTAFGTDNGGRPKALEEGQLMSLPEGVREHATKYTHPDAVR